MKTFWIKFEKILLVVHLSFLHEKQLLVKLLFRIQQTYANLLLGLTLENYNRTRCINPCRAVSIRVGISIQRRVDLRLEGTRTAAMKVGSFLCFQRTRPICKIEDFFPRGRQKKNYCFRVDGFCSHCNTVFEAMGCFYHFSPCQEVRPSLNEEDIHHVSKKRELEAIRRHYIQEKGFNVNEIRECVC